jgi:NADH dehydrogenase
MMASVLSYIEIRIRRARESRVGDVLQIIQSAVVLLAAPLYAGVLSRAAAIVQCKRGPSVLQPYRDLRKLLRKGSATSDQASWIFHGAPFVAFACYLTVSAIVPIITDEPLPLAFLADLIGGAFVLSLASSRSPWPRSTPPARWAASAPAEPPGWEASPSRP